MQAQHPFKCDEAEKEREGGQQGEHPRGVEQEEEEDEVENFRVGIFKEERNNSFVLHLHTCIHFV